MDRTGQSGRTGRTGRIRFKISSSLSRTSRLSSSVHSLEAVKDFGPNIVSSCHSIANGLWAFVCSPVEVSGDVLDAAYELGVFLSQHEVAECLDCAIPELRELRSNWKAIDDISRGNQLGYIIGKYGLDILLPGATLKAVQKYSNLKRANALFALECCQASQVKQAVILQESAKRAAARAAVLKEAREAGRILFKNANARHHVLQKKHAWDRLIVLSGNVEEDSRKVIV